MTESAQQAFIHTNVHVFYTIAQESYTLMNESLAIYRRPKPGGEPGFIISPDPDQMSFKHSFITIVFCGMFLESALHILIVQREGVDVYKEYDYKSYEEKLSLLGCDDQAVIDQCNHLRKVRREIVHEKAYINTDSFRVAQNEADAAIKAINGVVSYFNLKMKS